MSSLSQAAAGTNSVARGGIDNGRICVRKRVELSGPGLRNRIGAWTTGSSNIRLLIGSLYEVARAAGTSPVP